MEVTEGARVSAIVALDVQVNELQIILLRLAAALGDVLEFSGGAPELGEEPSPSAAPQPGIWQGLAHLSVLTNIAEHQAELAEAIREALCGRPEPEPVPYVESGPTQPHPGNAEFFAPARVF